jgi:hypothetical protein
MKLTFVLRIRSRPTEGSFEGWVEEVDSCTEEKFRSTAELLSFLGKCFDKASSANPEGGEGRNEPPDSKTKN